MSLVLLLLISIAYHGVKDNFFSSDDFVWLKNAIRTVEHPSNIVTKDIASWFRPLGHLAFAINYWFFGVENPFKYALVSILWHFMISLSVFILVTTLTHDYTIALCSAMLFAIQHIHWEAVVWSSSFAEILAAFWYIITIICFLKWREISQDRENSQLQFRKRLRIAYYILSHITLVCSFLSAESAVTLPVMLLITDLLYYPNNWKISPLRSIFHHIWFWLLTTIYVAYELSFQLNNVHLGQSGDYKIHSQFFLTLFRSLLAYIFPRSVLLFMLENQTALLAVFMMWILIIVLGALTLICIKMPRPFYKHAIYGCLWAVVTMLPFCGFTRFTIIDSRHFYFSSIGVSLLFSLAIVSFFQSLRGVSLWGKVLKKGTFGLCGLAIFSWNILEIWHEEAIFGDYASEGAEILQTLRQSYAEFPLDAQFYFAGLYTPDIFLANMMFVYYSINPSQVHYVNVRDLKKLLQQKEFEQPTYFFIRQDRNLSEWTPEQFKYVLPKNGKIDIGTQIAQKYLAQGFFSPETWTDSSITFVWSKNSSSTIRVGFLETGNDRRMELRIKPFQFSNLPQQAIDIFLNEHVLTTLQLSDDFASYEIVLPKEHMLASQVNTIRFHYSYAISPSKASQGKINDGRRLAVAFDYIAFTL